MLNVSLKPIVFSILLVGTIGCKYYGGKPEAPFRATGTWYRVETGDTIASVASRYKTEPETVAELNDLAGDGALLEREEIFIPTKNGRPPGDGTKLAPMAKTPAKEPTGNKKGTVNGKCTGGDTPCLAWPASGEVTGTFGKRSGGHHDGIDIKAKKNAPVAAAAAGDVLYSGDDIKGYGNLVIIRHKNDIITVYAHNERNLVKEGDKVKRGEPIALLGQTGSAPSPQLHFEVRQGDEPKDPLQYLSPKR